MPKFLIEREIPDVGTWTPAQLNGAAKTSCGALQEMGPSIQWVHSYVTADKVYCVYIAPDEAAIRLHAATSGFPANVVSEIKATIDPVTAEA